MHSSFRIIKRQFTLLDGLLSLLHMTIKNVTEKNCHYTQALTRVWQGEGVSWGLENGTGTFIFPTCNQFYRTRDAVKYLGNMTFRESISFVFHVYFHLLLVISSSFRWSVISCNFMKNISKRRLRTQRSW